MSKRQRRLGRGIEALLGAAGDDFAEESEPATIFDEAAAESKPSPPSHASTPSGQTDGWSPNVQRGTDRAFARTPDPAPTKAASPGEAQALIANTDPSGARLTVSIDLVDRNPYQPRRDFAEADLASLAESLKRHEMLQPILVRTKGDRYELISGERRLRAAERAGWTEVPAILREADDRLVAELAIVENVQRKDLDPLEKAWSFRRYLEEHGCTQEELAKRIALDRATIANLIRLLDLPEFVQDHVRRGEITAGHARALLRLSDEQDQDQYCRRVMTENLSVRATEQLIAEHVESASDGPVIAGTIGNRPGAEAAGRNAPGRGAAAAQKPQLSALAAELRVALGTKVDVSLVKKGKGKIVIHFTSDAEFERLRGHLLGETLTTAAG